MTLLELHRRVRALAPNHVTCVQVSIWNHGTTHAIRTEPEFEINICAFRAQSWCENVKSPTAEGALSRFEAELVPWLNGDNSHCTLRAMESADCELPSKELEGATA